MLYENDVIDCFTGIPVTIRRLEDDFVEPTIEALDDIVNGNRDNGNEKLDISIKFFQDRKHIHPQVFSRASKRINNHLINILAEKLDDSEKSIQIMKLINTMADSYTDT